MQSVRVFIEEADKALSLLPPRTFNKDNLMEQTKSLKKMMKTVTIK